MTDKVATIVLATELTAAWLANPNTRVDADAVPAFFTTVHAVLARLDAGEPKRNDVAPGLVAPDPAVSVRKSLASPDRIISMIDGKPYRMLRRHLSTNGLTPDEYRARYNLKPDYPMVAPSYSEARRAMAVKIGFGRKPASPPVQETAASKPSRRKLGVSTKGDDA